jgi:hypothetical protein
VFLSVEAAGTFDKSVLCWETLSCIL